MASRLEVLDRPIGLPSLMSDWIVRKAGSIASGELLEGARLPAERELARRLGVSRVSRREGLRALQELGLVATRRGSGATVRPRRDWSLAALPGLLSSARADLPLAAGLRPWAVEALALRRSFARRFPTQLAGQLAPGSLTAARRRAERAWAVRASTARFVELDASALRPAPEAAGAAACAWLWNDLTKVAVSLGTRLPGLRTRSRRLPGPPRGALERSRGR